MEGEAIPVEVYIVTLREGNSNNATHSAPEYHSNACVLVTARVMCTFIASYT